MKHVYKVHGETIVDIYINVVAESLDDAISLANQEYRDYMEDYTNGTVGFDEGCLRDCDEFCDSEMGVNEISFDDTFAEDLGQWDGCDAPENCHNCEFFDECQHREEENSENV